MAEANIRINPDNTVTATLSDGKSYVLREPRAKDMREEMRKSGTATRTQERELSRLQMQGHRLRDSFIRQAGSIRENAAALRKSGVDTRNLADGQQLLKNRMEQVFATAVRQKAALERLAAAEGGMKSAGAMAGTIGLKAAGYGLFARQVGRGLGHPVKAAMEEEDAMLGIVKQVQGLKNADNSLNHAEIAKVRTEIQGLSRELPVATTEIMAMYEAGARMDVPRQELAGYVKTAAIAATAFDAEDMGALRVRPNSTAFSAKLTKNVPVLCWWNCRFSSGGT